jgi:hypothetical protein
MGDYSLFSLGEYNLAAYIFDDNQPDHHPPQRPTTTGGLHPFHLQCYDRQNAFEQGQQALLLTGHPRLLPSFGIVTSYSMKTHPIPPEAATYLYQWVLNTTESVDALARFQVFAETGTPSTSTRPSFPCDNTPLPPLL